MRISDWSSDVCSSDLRLECSAIAARRGRTGTALLHPRFDEPVFDVVEIDVRTIRREIAVLVIAEGRACRGRRILVEPVHRIAARDIHVAAIDISVIRSEEDTSELQSLMRNSYAVFCLKKKTDKK